MTHDSDDSLRRAVVQQLESFRRAGVTHVPRSAAPATPPAQPVAAPVPARPLQPNPTPMRKEPSRPATPAKSLFAPADAAAVGSSLAPAVSPNMPPEERQRILAETAQRVSGCVRCDELACSRTKTVFGVGDVQAKLLFIGEAPGADEDATGIPFVGKAGQLLDKIIEACGFRRQDVYICNVLKCRPPGNRNPSPTEADNCREYLDIQLAVVDPDYIVCWGSIAANNLLGVKSPIGKLRGTFHRHGRAKVLCTYHPSYLLRNPAAKKDVWEDMKILLKEMGREPKR